MKTFLRVLGFTALWILVGVLLEGQQVPTYINGTPPPYVFAGAGVSQSGQTFTFSGGGSFTAAGDLSGTSSSQTVIGLNGTLLSGLASGFLFNTTATGVPSTVGATGSGNVVRATSATLVTPTLGAASATSLTLTNALTPANGGSGATTCALPFGGPALTCYGVIENYLATGSTASFFNGIYNSSTIAECGSHGTDVATAASATLAQSMKFVSGGGANDCAGYSIANRYWSTRLAAQGLWAYTAAADYGANSSCLWWGWSSGTQAQVSSGGATPNYVMVAISYCQATDVSGYFQCVSGNAGSVTRTPIGTAAPSTNPVIAQIVNNGVSGVTCSVTYNGNTYTATNATAVSTSAAMTWIEGNVASGSTAVNLFVVGNYTFSPVVATPF